MPQSPEQRQVAPTPIPSVPIAQLALRGFRESPWELVRALVSRHLGREVAVRDIGVAGHDFATLYQETKVWAMLRGLPPAPEQHPHGHLVRGLARGTAYVVEGVRP